MTARLLLVAALGLGGCRSSAPEGDASAIAFVGVTVLPMTNDVVLPRQTVIVRDGVIARIGDAASTPVPNLLLVGVDPISTSDFAQHIVGVMARGKWMPMEDLQAAREALSRTYADR